MGSMTESDWWHWYATPFLSAEIAVNRLNAQRLRESSLHIWSLPRQ